MYLVMSRPVCVDVFDFAMQGRISVPMHIREILAEIQRKTGENQSGLARRFRVTQPTVSRWFRGSSPEGDHQERIKFEGCRLGIIDRTTIVENLSVPIVGFVGAGGQILFSEGQGPFGEAKMPPKGVHPATVAVVVRGDSMSGLLEDGWTIYYDSRLDEPSESLLGKLCVIELADGRVLVKKLYKGRGPGLYDLYSANAEPLQDQPVRWAAKVNWIEPK